MVRVSVVIPAYDALACIGAAIASVQAQTMPALEILVVDDASQDGTIGYVQALAAGDARLRLLRAPSNGGPGKARNLGIAAASGEWIALLDADDRYHPDRLAALLELGRRSSAEMVSDNLMLHGPDTTAPMLREAWLPTDGIITPRGFVEGNMLRGAGRAGFGYLKPMIRRRFLAEHRISYEPVRFSEDYLLYLTCLLHGARWAISERALYDYTVSAGSLTASHSAADLTHLAEAETAMLDWPMPQRDRALARSMARHIAAVRRARAWFCFASALKRRDAAAAVESISGDPRLMLHIGREGLRALPRALGRAGGRA